MDAQTEQRLPDINELCDLLLKPVVKDILPPVHRQAWG